MAKKKRVATKVSPRASASFTPAELDVLDIVLRGINLDRDISFLVRDPAFQSVAKTATRMKKRLYSRKG